jgi:hypothetical protein
MGLYKLMGAKLLTLDDFIFLKRKIKYANLHKDDN